MRNVLVTLHFTTLHACPVGQSHGYLCTAFLSAHRYDVFLFSKPDTLLAVVSLPVVKLMQLRYVNDSATAMAKAVK